jgi:hypothetical protein
MRNNVILAIMAVAALGLSACKEKSTTSMTDANGTTTETTVSKDVTNHSDGTQTGTVDSKTTVDPQGMMNKTTTQETHTEVK